MMLALTATLSLAGRPVELISLRLSEQLSCVTEARAEIACEQEMPLEGLAGAAAQLQVLINGEPVRSWSLVIGRMELARVSGDGVRYQLRLYNDFWLLRHTRGVRKFRNLSAQDIVSAVLSEGGVAHTWQITRTPPVRKYCMQYRESHFDFVSRLLEFEGIYYAVQSDGTLLLQDDSGSAPMVDGDTDFTLLEHGDAMQAAELGLYQFGRGARVCTGKVTLGDYNWKKPRVKLRETATGAADTELERYAYPAGFRKPADGKHLAQVQLEAHRARARFARGGGNVVSFTAGRRFRFDGEELLLLKVVHELELAEERQVYSNHFEAIDAATRFRAPASTPRPVVQGCHTVMVRGPAGEEIHTDQYGRFRAQFHWDREATGTDQDSRWLRKLQEPTTSVNLARVGWEVSVAYIDGDPDRPLGLARDINGQMVPAYGQPIHKTVMTIKTPSYPGGGGYNEIKLEDRAGAQQFNWRAERDMQIQVNHDKTHRVGRNETRIVEHKAQHEVGRDQTVRIGADQLHTVASQHQLAVGADRTVTVAGDQRSSADGGVSVSVAGHSSEAVGSLRFSLVGEISPPKVNPQGLVPNPQSAATGAGKAALSEMQAGGGVSGGAAAAKGSLGNMVPTPEGAAAKLSGGLSQGNLSSLINGSVARTAQEVMSRTVGGVHLAVSAKSVSASARRVYAETIGGAKLTLSKEGIAQSGGKLMAITTGGAVFRKAKGDMGYGSEKHRVIVGGLSKLVAKENLEINGAEVILDAGAELRLKSGDLEIVMKPDEICISGDMRFDSRSKVVITGNKDDIAAE